MRKYLTIALLGLLAVTLAVLAAGCGSGGSRKEAGGTTYVDDLGREVVVEEAPERIVSISPACTEILFALGLGNKVFGVTKYCDYPQEATDKPEIGTFTTPNIEAIVDAKPDLVLASGGVQRDILDRLDELGLTVYAVNPKTFNETVESIGKIGEITGAEKKAEEITDDMEKRAEKIDKEVKEKNSSGQKEPGIFYEVYYENNVWTAGRNSVISDLISRAGGRNIGDVEASDYYEFSLEQLIADNPDVYMVGSGSMSKPGDVTARQGWDLISAVKNGRIYVMEEDLVYRTGPRLIDGLETIFEAINQ